MSGILSENGESFLKSLLGEKWCEDLFTRAAPLGEPLYFDAVVVLAISDLNERIKRLEPVKNDEVVGFLREDLNTGEMHES